MEITKTELISMKFSLTHAWIQSGQTIKATVVGNPTLAKARNPMVYAWVSPIDEDGERFRLLYVGKAGGGLAERLRQHEGGFKSGTGRKNYDLINTVLSSGKEIFIYQRVSDLVEILGQKISIYSSEEEALCDRFAPVWNRAQFAKGSRVLSKSKKSKKEKVVESQIERTDLDCTNLVRGSEVINFINSLDDDNNRRFDKLMSWALGIEGKYDLQQKIILGYTNQPVGCNGVPMLVFAEFGKAGKAKPNSWKIRIPLRVIDDNSLSIVLPTGILTNGLNERLITIGKHDNFRPIDIDDFLKNPSKYVNL